MSEETSPDLPEDLTAAEYRRRARGLLQKAESWSNTPQANRMVEAAHVFALCAMSAPVPVEPGLCWAESECLVWPDGRRGEPFRCELRAGHAGAHEAGRGSMGGTAVWTDHDTTKGGGE